MQHIVNAQGLNMPKLGLGTWPMLGEECTRAVEQALALGYRHIDTAAVYNNEDLPQSLRSEYVDLFMLHWPSTDWDLPRTIETLVSFREQGLAPKASSESNQLANLAAMDVRLDDEDRALIASLSKRERQVSPDFAPVWDAFDE